MTTDLSRGGRRRWRPLAVAAVAAAALVPALHQGPARAALGTGSWTQYTYTPPGGGPGTRVYYVYVPTGLPAGAVPLVVYLHGCTQTATDAAIGTRWNELADVDKFIVAYPQQTVTPNSSAPLADGNGAGCWNWFLPQDQSRGGGEPATIAGITTQVMQTEPVDPSRVFVIGASAGADMAGILGATYPDLYAAVGAAAGCAYASCSDATGALAYQAMGSHARVVPAFVVQGTADTLNAFPLGVGQVQQWLGTDDLADDGAPNGSVPRVPAAVTNSGFDQTPQPGSGDPCIRYGNFPCPGGIIGFRGTYPTTVAHYADARGCDLLDFWVVHGLEHAWPNGDPNGSFTDPLGPDITAAAYSFFLSHPMTGGGCPSP